MISSTQTDLFECRTIACGHSDYNLQLWILRQTFGSWNEHAWIANAKCYVIERDVLPSRFLTVRRHRHGNALAIGPRGNVGEDVARYLCDVTGPDHGKEMLVGKLHRVFTHQMLTNRPVSVEADEPM